MEEININIEYWISIFCLFANKRSNIIFAISSGGGDQCGRLDLGRRLPQDSGCQETQMHGPGA